MANDVIDVVVNDIPVEKNRAFDVGIDEVEGINKANENVASTSNEVQETEKIIQIDDSFLVDLN